MRVADGPGQGPAKLLSLDAEGRLRRLARADLGSLFEPGDLVIANDAATLPASLAGTHAPTGEPVEVRLAGWLAPGDPRRFVAVVFGAGDHRVRTEDRPPPPPLKRGDHLLLGSLVATVERTLDHPRLVALRFADDRAAVLDGIARHGRPIQYAHAPESFALWDVWTPVAAVPFAFEPPSAGFALDWATIAAWRKRGVGFATLTHAAGISSTGEPRLDARLPFDEPYAISDATAAAIERAQALGRRVIAIGTTVVRALESAADNEGNVQPGEGIATGRIGPGAKLRVVDAILSGVHEPGESHYELLRAFAADDKLRDVVAVLEKGGFRTHEFGDSVLIERPAPTLLHDADDWSVS